VYLRTLASHLELALSAAIGFERIQQLARALSESNEFKDDLLAMLAHDFKGPLTVIAGYCELLLENAPAAVHEELETIYSQTQRLVQLSEDALALAQTQAGGFSLDRSILDLREVVAESVKARNRAEDRIRFEAPSKPVPVSLDPGRFNHVLDNLLMNALKYSDGEVLVRVTEGDENASIAVIDRGIGIPKEELAQVFTRFGRGSNARRKGISGSGVGLYVSRKIVDVHGGSIAVASTEGRGSTFTITLPLAETR
jgi:signal transduction histidine kinase